MINVLLWIVSLSSSVEPLDAWSVTPMIPSARNGKHRHFVLSEDYLENDLVAVQTEEESSDGNDASRLCVVRPDNTVLPLCRHLDDVETELFVDQRCYGDTAWWEGVVDERVVGRYGEGGYGQRPVPSLGGGPGYGAEASEIWSVPEELLEQLGEDGVGLPVLDVGIAHGEKARGGSY